MNGTYPDIKCLDTIAGSCAKGNQFRARVGNADLGDG